MPLKCNKKYECVVKFCSLQLNEYNYLRILISRAAGFGWSVGYLDIYPPT